MKGVFIVLIFLGPYVVLGQCCSGGVPMSGNLGMPVSDPGTLQLSLNYDLNNLQTLKSGSNTINDRTRERQTHAVLLEFAYAISQKWSVDGFLSYVRQERTIQTRPGESDFTYTQGLGDAVLLLKYQVIRPVSIGYGLKFPLGNSNRTHDGLPLNADLQPGSGAWDQIAYVNITNQFAFRPSLTYLGTVLYRFTGTNERYLGGSSYEFGNEWQVIGGLADRYVLGSVLIDPSLKMRFRKANRDRFNGFGFPASGGTFLFINPGISWQIFPQLAWQVNLELPVYARVLEVQLSPTFRMNTGLYYAFNPFKRTKNPFGS